MDNYIETMEEWTGDRGRLVGAAFGEGFRQYRYKIILTKESR
jgi:hypothetical protein